MSIGAENLRVNGSRVRIRRGIAAALLVLASIAIAQQPTITPNYKDADIRKIVEAVGAVTGKNFILDPRVNAKVTMLSSSEMSPDAFYEAFLSILEVHGYVAMTSGDVIKILPDASARTYPGSLSTDGAGADLPVHVLLGLHFQFSAGTVGAGGVCQIAGIRSPRVSVDGGGSGGRCAAVDPDDRRLRWARTSWTRRCAVQIVTQEYRASGCCCERDSEGGE